MAEGQSQLYLFYNAAGGVGKAAWKLRSGLKKRQKKTKKQHKTCLFIRFPPHAKGRPGGPAAGNRCVHKKNRGRQPGWVPRGMWPGSTAVTGPSLSSPSHGQHPRGLRTHLHWSRASPRLGSPWHDLTGPVLNLHSLTEDPESYASR